MPNFSRPKGRERFENSLDYKQGLDPVIAEAGTKNLFWRIVGGLNRLFNPSHAWTDYSQKADSSVMNKFTGSALTPAEIAANQFSSEEAQKQRDWETEMSNTAFQRQVTDMKLAGVNPALAMSGSSGASTPSGSAPSSVSPQSGMSLGDILQLMLLPMQKKLMASQARMASDQGEAALITARAAADNASTNARNAGTNEQNALTARFNAESQRMQVEIDRARARSQINVNEADAKRIAEQTAFIQIQREQLPKRLEIAEKNADSEARRAIAALRQADAAVQNAATNDRLADYETSLKYAEELFTWYRTEGQKVINQFLPEKTRVEIDNMIKDGVRLDAQGRLINKTGHLVDAQTVSTYVNAACSVSNAVNRWVNPLSGMSSAMPSDWILDNSINPGAALQMYGGM